MKVNFFLHINPYINIGVWPDPFHFYLLIFNTSNYDIDFKFHDFQKELVLNKFMKLFF